MALSVAEVYVLSFPTLFVAVECAAGLMLPLAEILSEPMAEAASDSCALQCQP